MLMRLGCREDAKAHFLLVTVQCAQLQIVKIILRLRITSISELWIIANLANPFIALELCQLIILTDGQRIERRHTRCSGTDLMTDQRYE